MKEYERKQLLERVEREGATVGVSIPEETHLDGEPFALKRFVLEVQRLDPADVDRGELTAAKKKLRRERVERKQRLESADLSREEGERIAETVVGIDRALNALDSLGATDLEGATEAQERADQKRWYAFLRQALGHDQQGRRSR